LTAQGTILGTYQYMSPEQAEGKEADARSDIFSLGAVLHEMATGQRALAGKSSASVIAAILEREPPPISTMQPVAPPALDRVVKKCLAKDPDERWQSAGDLCEELKWIAESGSQANAPRAAAVTRRTIHPLVGWSVAGLLGLALLTLLFAMTRASSDNAKAITLSVEADVDDWSRDGRFIMYERSGAGIGSDLWVLPLTGDKKPYPFLQAPYYVAHGRFSPDGKWVAYASNESGQVQIYVESFPAGHGKWQISIMGEINQSGAGTAKKFSTSPRTAP
jgi:eukaryotic-like serine/threonine-protein kinase